MTWTPKSLIFHFSILKIFHLTRALVESTGNIFKVTGISLEQLYSLKQGFLMNQCNFRPSIIIGISIDSTQVFLRGRGLIGSNYSILVDRLCTLQA